MYSNKVMLQQPQREVMHWQTQHICRYAAYLLMTLASAQLSDVG